MLSSLLEPAEPSSSPGMDGPDLITLNAHPLHEVKMSTGSLGYSMASSNTSIVDTLTDTVKSGDSDRTVSITSGSGSTDSERTLAMRLDSQDSQASETGDYERWPRQNSVRLPLLLHLSVSKLMTCWLVSVGLILTKVG